jgi:hypothetical protein
MVRTQVQLTTEQLNKLKQLAAQRGVSIAELVREGVDVVLQSASTGIDEKRRRALAAVGRFHSGQKDISARHDDYLTEAYSE